MSVVSLGTQRLMEELSGSNRGLKDWVKDAKVRRSISANSHIPLPIQAIGGRISIEELFFGVLGSAESPVEVKVFIEKGSGNHAYSVMHEVSFRQFMRVGIHQWMASPTLLSCLEWGWRLCSLTNRERKPRLSGRGRATSIALQS
nr:hypothetical protein [Ferrimicrobium sp.]